MTRPRQEARVIANLRRLGLRHCAPEWMRETFVRGRRFSRSEWLFPRYVFVQVDFTHTPFNYLKYLSGVAGFVRCAQQLVEVSETLVHRLQHADGTRTASPPKPAFNAGDAVRLNGGAYQDIAAVFLEPEGEARSRILLRWLGRELETSVDNLYLATA